MLLLDSSPIDFSYVQTAVQFVCEKYKVLLDVVTDGEDHTTSAGRLVGVFEGFFDPKENGPARKSRDESIQKSIDSNVFSAQSIPDCFVRELMKEFDRLGWERVHYAEGS